MKLSEKGCSKLGKVFQGFPLPSHIFIRLLDCDFEADDFQDGYCQNGKDNVTLTLEEAKKISDALEWVDGYMYSYAYKKVIEDFNKRIEQSQSGNAV